MKSSNRFAYHGIAVVATLAVSCAARQTQPANIDTPSGTTSTVAVPDTREVSTNDLLDQMQKLGDTLTSLRADIDMQTTDGQSGERSSRVGSFLLQKRGEGDSRARVSLNKLIVEDDEDRKKIIPERIEYLLEGDWVIDRVYGRGLNDPGGRRETHRQIRKPGEKVDLLKLGEGPFPLPIGQPRDSVRAQFEVTRLPDDPEKAGLAGLELRPREETRLARRFHQIVIWIDLKDAMPRIIETVSASVELDPSTGKQTAIPGTETKKTVLTNVKINDAVTDQDFKLEEINVKEWSIVSQEYQE